ncbi:MAG: hypothetical protein HUU38_11085, partial [Anaerolineales bacterium]|nr:hypothetical protein [Anaerolineales bacterium]
HRARRGNAIFSDASAFSSPGDEVPRETTPDQSGLARFSGRCAVARSLQGRAGTTERGVEMQFSATQAHLARRGMKSPVKRRPFKRAIKAGFIRRCVVARSL